MRQPRVAQLVADQLRAEILRGDMPNGATLPPQEELMRRFEVSLPAVREALGILEHEGLVTVRRGNVGGASVHPPTLRSAAYMVTLILESRQGTLADVAAAVEATEPICAALCATREDRETAVIPALVADMADLEEASAGDPLEFNRVARQFHELIVELCGNESLRISVGALVAIWSAHEAAWTEAANDKGTFPGPDVRRQVLRAHAGILRAIRNGDANTAARLASKHIDAVQQRMHYASGGTDELVASALLRGEPTTTKQSLLL
jgi:GntR family transcriptional repressor for pyruvate dehydrogenase complex